MRTSWNGGLWTKARYQSFIKSALRSASRRWGPKHECLKDAFHSVMTNQKSGRKAKHYKCASCQGLFPASEVAVDHIEPVVPMGWNGDWNVVIDRMYCEKDNLQVLCKGCHDLKSAAERIERKKHG